MGNKKGFTLIELLAVIVILSIIMIVAVPNVIAIINKQEKNAYINDAKKLITMAKYKMSSDTEILYPAPNGLVFLEYDLINNGDLTTDGNGLEYSNTDSFVVVALDSQGYLSYWVQLISEGQGKTYGVGLISEEDLSKDSAIEKIHNLPKIGTDSTSLLEKVYNSTSGTVVRCNKKGCE